MIKKILLMLFCLLVLFHAGLLAAEDFSFEAKSKTKKIRIKGIEDYKGIIAWVPVSEKKNVGFEWHFDKSLDKSMLTSFTFANNGKLSQGQILDLARKRFHTSAADAIWLGSLGQSSVQSSYPWGLLFVFFANYSNKGESMALMVSAFDANGFLVRDWNRLISLDSPGPGWLGRYGASVGATVGDSCIGVVLNVGFEELHTGKKKNHVKPQAYFLRTDYNGVLLGKPVSLKLLNKSQDQSQRVFRPAWNGKRWLVPVSNNGWDRKYINQVNLYTSTNASANKFRVKKFIETDSDKDLIFSLDGLSLVPAPKKSAVLGSHTTDQEDEYLLFVQHSSMNFDGQSVDMNKYRYFLYPVSGKGKPAGKKIEVLLPMLQHSIKYDRRYFTNHQSNYLSNIVPSYESNSAVSVRGSQENWLYLVQTHTILLQPFSASLSFPIEHQLNLFAINPEDGSVASLEKKSFKWEYYYLRDPILAWNGKQLVQVFNSSTFFKTPTKCNSYISVFNPN